MKRDSDETVLTTTEARQGVRAGVIQVLLVSLSLALIAGVLLYIYYYSGSPQ